jgi:hypothetical protein
MGRPDGQVLLTGDGNFTPAELLVRYGTGDASFVAAPKFADNRYYFLAPDSPGVDAGTDVSWKELGSEGTAPRYPSILIDGEEAVLLLWGKMN